MKYMILEVMLHARVCVVYAFCTMVLMQRYFFEFVLCVAVDSRCRPYHRLEDSTSQAGEPLQSRLRPPSEAEFSRLDEGDPDAVSHLRIVFRARKDIEEVTIPILSFHPPRLHLCRHVPSPKRLSNLCAG